MNEIDQLLEYARQAAGMIPRPAVRCTNYAAIAGVFLESGNKELGLEVLADALKTADLLKYPDEKAKQLAWIAGLYVKAGDSVKSRELFTRACLLSRATETAAQKAEALYSIACEYADAGLSEDASKILSELYETAVDPENHLDSVCELINVAALYADIGQVEKAGGVLVEVVDISSALKDNWFKAERLIEAAEIYAGMDAGEKVDHVLYAASSIVNFIDEANRSNFLLKMVDIFTTTGRKARALDLLDGLLSIVNHHPASPSSPQDLIEVAEDYARLGDEETSAGVLTQAKTLIERIENDKDKIYGLINLSGGLNRIGRREKGLELANQALALCGAVLDKKAVPFILGSLAVSFTELKDPGRAFEAVSRIVQTLQETPVKTSGLGAIVNDLSAAGEKALALRLFALIREPDVKAGALTAMAQNLVEAGQI